MGQCFTLDVVQADHRGALFAPTDTRDGLLARMRSVADVTLEARPIVNDVHLLGDAAVVVSLTITGQDREGGLFENPMVNLYGLSDDGITRFESFPANAVDSAIEAANSLSSSSGRRV